MIAHKNHVYLGEIDKIKNEFHTIKIKRTYFLLKMGTIQEAKKKHLIFPNEFQIEA